MEQTGLSRAQKSRTAIAQIRSALIDKGYRVLSILTPKEQDSYTREFICYAKGQTVLFVQIYRDGGCEVWKPLTDSIRIQDTIDALPD